MFICFIDINKSHDCVVNMKMAYPSLALSDKIQIKQARYNVSINEPWRCRSEDFITHEGSQLSHFIGLCAKRSCWI